jgi:hypothetical protein
MSSLKFVRRLGAWMIACQLGHSQLQLLEPVLVTCVFLLPISTGSLFAGIQCKGLLSDSKSSTFISEFADLSPLSSSA